ncbi:MsnO8 family LLM class oxidoreductase [Corynebacterium nuruki]
MKYSLVELAPVTPGGTKTDALHRALDAATEAEQLGYHRIWYAEHHNTTAFASQAPEQLIALAASRTENIRVGSGAVLLNHYSPYATAERFLQLEALTPGRIDLGMGRANSGPPVDLALARTRDAPLRDDYASQVTEIIGYLHHALPEGHDFAALDPTRGIGSAPQAWVLGSSGNSAELAGQLGIGYAFAGFINPNKVKVGLRHYRESFTPTRFGAGTPQVMLSVNMVAAPTEAEALELTWPHRVMRSRTFHGQIPTVADAAAALTDGERDAPAHVNGLTLPPVIAGTPDSLRRQLAPVVEHCGITEIMVQDTLVDPDLRSRSRALVAEALAGLCAEGRPPR